MNYENKHTKEKHRIMATFARGRILDVGCADSPNQFLNTAVGLDLVDFTASNYSLAIKGNAESMSKVVHTQFDTILSGSMIEHLENPSSFLQECQKLLKPGGLLVLASPNACYPLYVLSELFQAPKFIDDDHLFLFPYRIMLKLLKRNNWRVDEVVGIGLGSKVLPNLWRYSLIYVCRSELNEKENKLD